MPECFICSCMVSSVKVCDVNRGTLKNSMLVITFKSNIWSNLTEVLIRKESIHLVMGTVCFLNINKCVCCFFQVSDVRVPANGVSNEEDFFSF